MHFYFSGDYPAAIKLNGVYFGLIDGSVKVCDLEEGNLPLVEIIPLNGKTPPLAFLPDQAFLASPPAWVIVTDLKGGYMLKLQKPAFNGGFEVLAQEKFNDAVVTLFQDNGCKLSIETPNDFYAETFDFCVTGGKIGKSKVGDFELLYLSIYGDYPVLNLYTHRPSVKKIFSRVVEEFELTPDLTTTEAYKDMAKHKVVTKWGYDGERLTELTRAVTTAEGFSKHNLPERLIPFAFCEEFFVGGAFKDYLEGNVLQNADKLGGYLGSFIGVMPPPLFRLQTEVGLITSVGKNVYAVDYFTFELNDLHKITNIIKTT